MNPAILVQVSEDPDQITLVPAPDAPAGGADPTRRHGLLFPDGRVRHAGVARHEAEAVIAGLSACSPEDWGRLLIEVTLPVVLSDGAGPYLIDAEGRVTLALAAHPRIRRARVAMGAPSPGHRVGAVAATETPRLWQWLADAVVPPDRRVAALTALDEAGDELDLLRWQNEQRGAAGQKEMP